MANITKEYFDQKLDEKFREHTEAILAVVKQGFGETSERLDKLEGITIYSLKYGR